MTTAHLYALFLAHPQVTTDTRHCPKGSIFFALRGANFNGNRFARQALEAGCAYAVIDDPAMADNEDKRLVLVDDVLQALQALAAHHRKTLGLPVLQITGTNGKTTTKELCAAVLQRKFNVLFTEGNLNNHIGVPLTLLRLTKEHEIAIVETGANHPGEIALLSQIADPDYGLITNVGKAHLEGFGSFEGVKRTKAELYAYLRQKEGGKIFLHSDDADLVAMAKGLEAFTYGAPDSGADIEGAAVGDSAFLQICWKGEDGHAVEAKTQLIGAYNAANALVAIAVGRHFGLADAEIAQALADYTPSNNRSELKRTATNELIVDAYNANPTSMAAALDNFQRIGHGHKLAIIGEMRELGQTSETEHAAVVDRLVALGCEAWLVGEHFAPFANRFPWFADIDALKAHLTAHPVTNRLILIKGSNGTKLFQLPEVL